MSGKRHTRLGRMLHGLKAFILQGDEVAAAEQAIQIAATVREVRMFLTGFGKEGEIEWPEAPRRRRAGGNSKERRFDVDYLECELRAAIVAGDVERARRVAVELARGTREYGAFLRMMTESTGIVPGEEDAPE